MSYIQQSHSLNNKWQHIVAINPYKENAMIKYDYVMQFRDIILSKSTDANEAWSAALLKAILTTSAEYAANLIGSNPDLILVIRKSAARALRGEQACLATINCIYSTLAGIRYDSDVVMIQDLFDDNNDLTVAYVNA